MGTVEGGDGRTGSEGTFSVESVGSGGCRGGGFRGRIALLANDRFSSTGSKTSRYRPDRAGGNAGCVDYRDGATSGITGPERYLFEYYGNGDLEY